MLCRLPVNAHIGNIGVAPSLGAPVMTGPPFRTGGNLDNKRIGKGGAHMPMVLAHCNHAAWPALSSLLCTHCGHDGWASCMQHSAVRLRLWMLGHDCMRTLLLLAVHRPDATAVLHMQPRCTFLWRWRGLC